MDSVLRPTTRPRAGPPCPPWRGIALAALLALGGCSEPFGFIPGGALEGDEAMPPFDWSTLADVDNVQLEVRPDSVNPQRKHIRDHGDDNVQLEVRPDSPYSINIWAVGLGADAYVATYEDGTRWTEYLRETPDVRMRVGASIYRLLAVRVHDGEERERVSAAFAAKYDIDEDDNWVATGQVFRLDRHVEAAHGS